MSIQEQNDDLEFQEQLNTLITFLDSLRGEINFDKCISLPLGKIIEKIR